MSVEFDSDFVRAQFPAFKEPSLQGWAHFENAGGSYACRQVIDRFDHFYRRLKVQPYHPFPASRMAGSWMDEAYQRLAEWLCVAPDELDLAPSTTQNTYVLAQAFRAGMSAGDAIIVTNQDHEANSGAWRRMEDSGIEVREWQVDSEGHLDIADLDALLDEKVRVVCFPHCSNIVAEINPVREICDKVHAAGAVAVVDGVSYAPHGLPDMNKLGADVYLFSTYKVFGPHLGAMVVRRPLAKKLANQGHFFNQGHDHKHLHPAGPDHAQIAAAEGIATYFEAVEAHHFRAGAPMDTRTDRLHQLLRDRETELLQPLLDYVSKHPNVRLLGPADASRRAPTVSLLHERKGLDLATELAGHRIQCGGDHFYAYRLLEAMGIDPEHGVLRLSFTHYTTKAEINQLMNALDKVL